MTKKPTVLVILDGWGIGEPVETNAVFAANTPHFDDILARYPHGQLKAHGSAVGLPETQMGNSEVGHMTIGAGRVIWMDLPRIDNAISGGVFAKESAMQAFVAKAQASSKRVHIAGLFSNGGVHAHSSHIKAMAEICVENGLSPILHLFTDGRDVPPKEADAFFEAVLSELPESAKIATVSGRFYAMDRDNRWERVALAYEAIVKGKGREAQTAIAAVEMAYQDEETDEFITPTVIGDYDGFQAGDSLFFANFRADRARQILDALANPEFAHFERGDMRLENVLGMVNYSSAHEKFMGVLFPDQDIPNTLGEYLSASGKTQYHLAETEKYPHVTFFLNGGIEPPYAGEARYVAPSPKVKTYDLKPEMSAEEVGDHLEAAILSGEYDFIITNFANPDMVGHTGSVPAAVAACEAVDEQLGRAVRAIEKVGGKMIVTADHGNCDVMVDPDTGAPHTAHTLNPVPYILVGADGAARPQGGLSDLAPTVLDLMGLAQPEEMTGQTLKQ